MSVRYLFRNLRKAIIQDGLNLRGVSTNKKYYTTVY
jgi:hypothetical protein